MDFVQKMVLGTAQLGAEYGVGNIIGAPSRREASEILAAAWGAHIRHFDTAPGYGSEALIGEFVKAHGIASDVRILTKVPALGEQADWRATVEKTVSSSLKNTASESIEVLFFHHPADLELTRQDPDFFRQLLSDFPIGSLGVSVYEPSELNHDEHPLGKLAVQFPFNLLDRRFEENTVPHGMRYARSVFLQGLLASRQLVHNAPNELREFHATAHAACLERRVSLMHVALAFVKQVKCFDFYLVGVESTDQLREILQHSLVFDDELRQLTNGWRDLISQQWLDPRQWNSRTA